MVRALCILNLDLFMLHYLIVFDNYSLSQFGIRFTMFLFTYKVRTWPHAPSTLAMASFDKYI